MLPRLLFTWNLCFIAFILIKSILRKKRSVLNTLVSFKKKSENCVSLLKSTFCIIFHYSFSNKINWLFYVFLEKNRKIIFLIILKFGCLKKLVFKNLWVGILPLPRPQMYRQTNRQTNKLPKFIWCSENKPLRGGQGRASRQIFKSMISGEKIN